MNGHVYPITSADLTTEGIKDWTFGKIEVHAKIPSSLGTWPAIWTLGSNIGKTGWPVCGEIDIMEHVGFMPYTLRLTPNFPQEIFPIPNIRFLPFHPDGAYHFV
jgi:beta-glucanase (GH16 family)